MTIDYCLTRLKSDSSLATTVYVCGRKSDESVVLYGTLKKVLDRQNCCAQIKLVGYMNSIVGYRLIQNIVGSFREGRGKDNEKIIEDFLTFMVSKSRTLSLKKWIHKLNWLGV